MEPFYNILLETGKRKGFEVQDRRYFDLLKTYWGDKAHFMLAYLDVVAYQTYLSQNISNFEKKIADAKDQLRSYYTRQE